MMGERTRDKQRLILNVIAVFKILYHILWFKDDYSKDLDHVHWIFKKNKLLITINCINHTFFFLIVIKNT